MTAPSAASATSSIREGLVWLGSAVLVGRLIDLASLGVVLFFVTDHGLGEASVAWSISTIIEAVSANGVGMATTILQHPDLRETQVKSAFWYALGAGLLIAALVALSAPLVADLYGAPRLEVFLAIYALRHVALGATSVPLQMLNRELRYRDVAAAQTIATFLAAVVRATVAIQVGGSWALVIAHCSQAFALMLGVFFLSRFRPTLGFSASELKPLFPTSVRLTLADLTFQLFRNIDYVLVGYMLGMGPLGLYRVAFDVAMEVTVPLADLVNRSVTPVLARLKSRSAELHEAFLYSARVLGLLLSPVLVALFAIVPDVLMLLGSGRFLGATGTARLLIVAAAMRIVYQLFRPLLVATGRAAALLRLELLALILLGALLASALWAFGDQLGEESAGIAWIAVYPCLLGTVLALVKRAEGIRPRVFLVEAGRGFASLPLLGVAAVAVLLGLPAGTQPWLRLGLVVLAVVVAHVGFLRFVLRLSPRALLKRG